MRYTVSRESIFLSFKTDEDIHDIDDKPQARGNIDSYDFESYKTERLVDGVGSFDLSRNYKTLIYQSGYRLRVLKAGEKPSKAENGDRSGRETGWLNLQRVKVSIQPCR